MQIDSLYNADCIEFMKGMKYIKKKISDAL